MNSSIPLRSSNSNNSRSEAAGSVIHSVRSIHSDSISTTTATTATASRRPGSSKLSNHRNILLAMVLAIMLSGGAKRGTSRMVVQAFTARSSNAYLAVDRLAATTTTTSRFPFMVSTTRSATQLAMSSVMPGMSDQSATSKSRAPVRMPRNSPDDSDTGSAGQSQQQSSLSWNRLGLWTELVTCLQDDLELDAPTKIQSMVIPELLSGTSSASSKNDGSVDNEELSKNIAFLAATGSGKTLAYLLPIIQRIKHQEVFEGYERQARRPRALILAPTRELVHQISAVLKQLSHSAKVSSQIIVGGQDRGKQKKAMQQRPVDIVVATPGRLLKQWKDKDSSVFLGSVDTIILDEMDTMLEQGFTRELRQLLYPLLYKNGAKRANKTVQTENEDEELELKEDAPRLVCTSATMTQSVQKLIGDNPKRSSLAVSAKKSYVKQQTQEQQQQETATYGGPPVKLVLPKFRILSAPGLHKAVPRLEHVFVDVGNTDKISLLVDVVSSNAGNGGATIIFCNTASSVRAVQYALSEARVEALGYHGELNSNIRSENLRLFRQGAIQKVANKKSDGELTSSSPSPNVLVCTDLAARGLDIPQVDHVVMFDFPLNSLDYLHRSGRTARGNTGKGKVTALVAKRDKVLAIAIENAVTRGDALDGLSSRKSDYGAGGISGGQMRNNNSSNGRRTGGGKRDGPPRRGGPPPKRGGNSSDRRSGASRGRR